MKIDALHFTDFIQDTVHVTPGGFFVSFPLPPDLLGSELDAAVAAYFAEGNTVISLPLDQVKEEAKARIDAKAEAARLTYITAGAGQALEYEATRQEAERALAVIEQGGTLDPAAYPMLEAERLALAANGQAVDLAAVASQVVASWQAWLSAGAAIKQERRRVKLAIDAATSAEEVKEAYYGASF